MGKPYNSYLVLQNAVAATGNGEVMDVSGYAALAVQVVGTFVATIYFEGTVDGSNWTALQGVSMSAGYIATSATAADALYIATPGLSLFRARVTWSSGTSVTVTARAVTGVGAVATDTQLSASTSAIGSLYAGEAHIGEVGGSSKTFTITGATVAVTANTYATGQCMGAKLTLTDAGRINSGNVYLQSVVVQDLSAQSSALDVIIFNANPAATTFTNNAALDIADADLPKIAAVVSVGASDYKAFADSVVAQPDFNPRMITTDSAADLYAVLVCRGAPTYVANEVSLILGFMRD